MAGVDVIICDSDSVLEPDISSDGAIRPFMFAPQRGSFDRPFALSCVRWLVRFFFGLFVHIRSFPTSFFSTFGLTTLVRNEICSF